MTKAGYRKFMKGLGRTANTSLTARRVARSMGMVGRKA
jgi:hypothetical protein